MPFRSPWLQTTLLVIALAGRPLSGASQEPFRPLAGAQNTSGIVPVDSVVDGGQLLFYVCRGLNAQARALVDLRVSDAALREPGPCVLADFDGNGYIDVAVWGPLVDDSRRFVVLLLAGPRVVGRQVIENAHRYHLWLAPPRRQLGEFGEPVHAHPGLVQSGEGETTYYYVFDKASGKLRRHDLPSEWQ